jgi:hypothetical protein
VQWLSAPFCSCGAGNGKYLEKNEQTIKENLPMNNTNQINTLIEQVKQNGGSFDDFLAGYSALTATRTTPLGLNQWASTDKPTMEDFNRDNRIIDAELGKKADKQSPASYMLPIAEGMTTYYPSTYCKTQENLVVLIGSIRKGSIESPISFVPGDVLGIMPIGFRPIGHTSINATYYNGSGTYGGSVEISADGSIWIPGGTVVPGNTSFDVHFSSVFLAAE